MASLRASGGDTCQLRPPDTQRLLNYDRAKLVSIKVINFEFNNSPAREEGTGREKERERVDTFERFPAAPPKRSVSPLCDFSRARADATVRARARKGREARASVHAR